MTEDSGLRVKNIAVLPWKQKALLFKQKKISDFGGHFFSPLFALKLSREQEFIKAAPLKSREQKHVAS